MNKILLPFIVVIITSVPALSQDEGVVTKKARIGNDKSVFFDLGPSFTLGKNIGDYKRGLNVEVGFTKRLNRLLSIGPSLSFIQFKYDPKVTSAQGGDAYIGTGDPNDWDTQYNYPDWSYTFGYILDLKGGDLSLTSLAVNLKLNLWPVKDKSIISPYVVLKPFVSYAQRTAVSGSDTRYVYNYYEEPGVDIYQVATDDPVKWRADGYTSTWDGSNFKALKANSKVTGGVFIAPGLEFLPAHRFSLYLQAGFGYTLPVSFISTKSYDNTVDDYVKKEFPMVKKGFPSVNVQIGGSFNF